MQDFLSETALVALVGAFGGILLGLAARLGRFCTLGAIEDYFYGNSDARLRMWGAAIGVAVIGSYGAAALGLFDPADSLYLSQSFNLGASVFGGVVFGYGMALAGNCGFGALARLGGGDLRSFVIVLVMGLSAYVTLNGPLAAVRLVVFPRAPVESNAPGIAQGISAITGVSATTVGLLVGAIILVVSLVQSDAITQRRTVLWGGLVGAAVMSGWVGSSYIARTGFDAVPVSSHTFSAPIGETILYAMTSSGNSLSFGVGSVAGVLIGAFLGSLVKGHFRWEACEDPRELRRQIGGAALMGVGAVVALGCSVGQGLSAFSVLAYSAPVTLSAILIGAYIGLRQLIVGFWPAV